jgi:3-hydroxybutyrate dehydrogenase
MDTAHEVKQTMAGKTALVTGSTDGIGLASAKELLARGAKVMFTGIFTSDEQRARFNAEYAELQKTYGADKMDVFEADLTKESAPAELVARAAKLGGGHIDTLVHSAGVQRRKPLIAENPEDALTMKDMDWVYDINARAGFATVLAALPYMKNDAKGRSQITFLSSVHGLIGCPDSGPYCASKWAIEGFMHANKHELAKYGIRINAVNPAFIETALAIGPLKTIAGNVVTKQGLKPDDAGYQEAFDTAFEEAKQERLHLQINPETGKGEWIPMKDITDAVAGLADFSNGIGSGGNVQPDYGYVERGKEEAGAAIFEFKGQERGLRAALEAFDARNAKLAAGQGSGRGPRGG